MLMVLLKIAAGVDAESNLVQAVVCVLLLMASREWATRIDKD